MFTTSGSNGQQGTLVLSAARLPGDDAGYHMPDTVPDTPQHLHTYNNIKDRGTDYSEAGPGRIQQQRRTVWDDDGYHMPDASGEDFARPNPGTVLDDAGYHMPDTQDEDFSEPGAGSFLRPNNVSTLENAVYV